MSEETNTTTNPMSSDRPASRSFSRSQWGLLLVLASVNFTHILDFVIVMPLGAQLRLQLQINPQQLGAIVSAYGIAAMITGLLSSSIIDRFDRKKVLVTAFTGFVFATFYCGFAKDYTHLLIARSLTGLFGGLAASSVMAIVGDRFHESQRGKAIGVITSSFAVASVIGLPIGLSLANHFQQWNAPFFGIGIFAILILALSVVCLPSMTTHRTEVRRTPIEQFTMVIKQPSHLWAFAMMLTTVLGTFTIVPYIAPYLVANCGRTSADLPIIYAAAGACTLISLNLIGWACDRFGSKPMFMLCAAGAVLMTLIVTHLPEVSLWEAAGITSVFMVLASGRSVPAQAMMLRASDPTVRGAFMNINTAVTHFGTAVGPLITASIVGEDYENGPLNHFGTAGLIAAACGCAAVAISYRLRPFPSSFAVATEVTSSNNSTTKTT